MKKILSICLSLIILAGVGYRVYKLFGGGDEGQKAMDLYNSGHYVEARAAFLKLANDGNSGAAFNLGLMNEKGEGGPADYAQAAQWYRKAADGGDKDAMFDLGQLYDKGQGVTKSDTDAFNWYQKAANHDLASAKVNLGVMYANGQGITQNMVEAQKWFILAGDAGAKNRDILSKSLTPDQIAQAQQSAKNWKPSN
ncbi:MAG: tetratricopeptide repeat protein [Acidobacteriia bacterium]|nr:tetratricopeptide repeat protein [Terriglobia bacterium]